MIRAPLHQRARSVEVCEVCSVRTIHVVRCTICRHTLCRECARVEAGSTWCPACLAEAQAFARETAGLASPHEAAS